MLINWMRSRRDRLDFKAPLELGQPLSQDLNTHIHLFKQVAMYMGLKAENADTKELFIRSVRCLDPELLKDDSGNYVSFERILQAALRVKTQFSWMNMVFNAVKQKQDTPVAAAAGWKRQRPSGWRESYHQ